MLYHLSEEHKMLRQFVREFAESQLAPNAAEVDDKGVFAQQQYDALVEAGFAAPGIPEQYGGDGADAIASAIIMEEVARVCASSSTVISVSYTHLTLPTIYSV